MKAVKLMRAFAVPVQTAPLLLIVIFSALLTLARYATLLGIPLAILLFFGFFRYSFSLLDARVTAAAEPPVLSIEMMNPIGEFRSLVILFLVCAVFFGSSAASYWLSPAGVAIAGAIVLTLAPAMLGIQAVTGSVAQALNLRRCVELIRRLHSDYLFMMGCVLLVYLLSVWLAGLQVLPLMLRIALLMYAWLAVFALVGDVIRERQSDLGLDDAYEPELFELSGDADLQRKRNILMDRIYAEWRGGAHRNAWQTVMAQAQESAEPATELRWMYSRAMRWPDQGLAQRLAQELLPRLLDERRNGEALDLTRERLTVNADFRPLASADLLRLARLGRDGGDRAIARALLKDFARLFPDDPVQPVVRELLEQVSR